MATQASQIDTIITMADSIDLVVIFPTDPNSGATYAKKLVNAGIPVLMLNADVPKDSQKYVTAAVGPDNKTMAQTGGFFCILSIHRDKNMYTFLPRHEQLTAIDNQSVAGHKRRCRGCQEQGCPIDILHLTEPGNRMFFDHPLSFRTVPEHLAELGFDQAGRDRIDPHPVWPPFPGQAAGKMD